MGTHGRPRWPVGRAGVVACALGLVTLPVALILASTGHAEEAEPVAAPPCALTAEACVDLGAQEAWLIKDGVVTYGPVPISSGDIGEETPTGVFRVQWKHLDHISGESGVPMPYSVFFAPGGIAFHQGSLDDFSGGCVRLRLDDARVFFDGLTIGDEVQVL